MTAIQADGLSKSYRHFHVLDSVTFQVHAGECFALFGPNGAGKTTLLKILATVNRPTAGHFTILQHDGVREKEAIRRSIMMLAHGSHLYDDLNAMENLRFAMAMRGITMSNRQGKQALDRVDIGAFAEMKIRFFSAGMKKRLALAKAILAQPQVLFLDEPFTALDEAGIHTMIEFIHELRRGQATVFLTTHDRAKAAEVANRAGLLQKGTLSSFTIKNPFHDLS